MSDDNATGTSKASPTKNNNNILPKRQWGGLDWSLPIGDRDDGWDADPADDPVVKTTLKSCFRNV